MTRTWLIWDLLVSRANCVCPGNTNFGEYINKLAYWNVSKGTIDTPATSVMLKNWITRTAGRTDTSEITLSSGLGTTRDVSNASLVFCVGLELFRNRSSFIGRWRLCLPLTDWDFFHFENIFIFIFIFILFLFLFLFLFYFYFYFYFWLMRRMLMRRLDCSDQEIKVQQGWR